MEKRRRGGSVSPPREDLMCGDARAQGGRPRKTDKGGLLVWVCWAGWRGTHTREVRAGLEAWTARAELMRGGGKERSGSASGSRARWTIARVVRTDSSARQAPPVEWRTFRRCDESRRTARVARRARRTRARERARGQVWMLAPSRSRAPRVDDRGARDRRRAPLQTDAARPWLKRSASAIFPARTAIGDARGRVVRGIRTGGPRRRARRRGGRQPRTW